MSDTLSSGSLTLLREMERDLIKQRTHETLVKFPCVIIRLNIQLSNQHISGGGCFTVSSMLSSGIVVDTC